ncbi:hypothetical protein Esti_001132 [Eimeria stiedai]
MHGEHQLQQPSSASETEAVLARTASPRVAAHQQQQQQEMPLQARSAKKLCAPGVDAVQVAAAETGTEATAAEPPAAAAATASVQKNPRVNKQLQRHDIARTCSRCSKEVSSCNNSNNTSNGSSSWRCRSSTSSNKDKELVAVNGLQNAACEEHQQRCRIRLSAAAAAAGKLLQDVPDDAALSCGAKKCSCSSGLPHTQDAWMVCAC